MVIFINVNQNSKTYLPDLVLREQIPPNHTITALGVYFGKNALKDTNDKLVLFCFKKMIIKRLNSKCVLDDILNNFLKITP